VFSCLSGHVIVAFCLVLGEEIFRMNGFVKLGDFAEVERVHAVFRPINQCFLSGYCRLICLQLEFTVLRFCWTLDLRNATASIVDLFVNLLVNVDGSGQW